MSRSVTLIVPTAVPSLPPTLKIPYPTNTLKPSRAQTNVKIQTSLTSYSFVSSKDESIPSVTMMTETLSSKSGDDNNEYAASVAGFSDEENINQVSREGEESEKSMHSCRFPWEVVAMIIIGTGFIGVAVIIGYRNKNMSGAHL
jgi:hypothetical protein